jgi:alpha-L-fucosidase
MATRDQRVGWWREARFGMFIHWGVYSHLAGVWEGEPARGYAEHIQRIRKIPIPAYRGQVAARFNPTRFDADEWMRLAKRAGMGYFVITAKHHDGFAMYDSDVSEYTVVKATPWQRDPMRELRDAARRHGIRFGFYYSHAFDWGEADGSGNDWDYENPGGDRNLHGGRDWWLHAPELLPRIRRYVDGKAIPQVLELIRKYDPDILWFDTPHKLPPEENLRILRAAREAKPSIVVSGPAVQALPGGPPARFGDYASTADRPAELRHWPGDWEAIPTTNESYGYHRMDLSHKPPRHFVQFLAKAAARGGNLLMNIGPMGDGRFDPKDVAILDAIGTWMDVNGESIHGTTRTPLPVQLRGQSTRKGNRLYLHVFDWPQDGRLRVAGLKTDASAWLLADPGRTPVATTRVSALDVELSVPATAPDPWNSVVVLEFDAPIEADTAFYVPAGGPMVPLHVFDGWPAGTAIGFGDGKRDRDATAGWNRTDSGIDWVVRLTERARFRVAVDYAAPAGAGGTFEIAFGDRTLSGRVRPTENATTFTTADVGEITLDPGTFTIAIRPTSIAGEELMRLRRLELTPVRPVE